MNAKKMIIGLACVLAAAVAAQPVLAQETDSAAKKTNAGQTVAAPAWPTNLGREMKIVNSSEYMGDMVSAAAKCCWDGICKVCKQIVKNSAKYGMGGREMMYVRTGEALFERTQKKAAKPKPAASNTQSSTSFDKKVDMALRVADPRASKAMDLTNLFRKYDRTRTAQQDSLSAALEQANARAAQAAQAKNK